MRRATIVLIMLIGLAAPGVAAADGRFAELFPALPDVEIHSDQDISDLAQSMLDPNADSENNCLVTVPLATEGCTLSGYTYAGGQFVDHDITLDLNPSPTAPVDPRTLPNFRTFKLDLDSVYAHGPIGSPQLYAADHKHFRVQEPNLNGVRDLPRNPDGSAVLVEARNDENQVLAQVHVAFLKFHNRLIDEGYSFARAREFLTLHYQTIVAEDVLADRQLSPSLGRKPLNGKVVRKLARRILRPGQPDDGGEDGDDEDDNDKDAFTPIEFSGSAFRDGHSKVRLAYRLNGNNNCQNLQVFSLTAPDASLMGGRPIQAGREIDWGMFFDEFPKPVGCPNNDRNIQRKTDTLISASLFRLPNPFVSNASNVLAFLNMRRAQFYGTTSGENMARAVNQPVLTPAELGLSPDLAARFASGTPPWFYILRESAVREGGQRLGPTGSIIVAASFRAMLRRDRESILRRNRRFRPDPRVVGPDGKLTLSDVFAFAGVAGP